MPALSNTKHEHFASLIAAGETPSHAYILTGYSPNGAATSALRLRKKADVAARIAELRTAVAERSIEKASVDRAWVIARLKENVERCMQREPVLNSRGESIGQYRYEASAANRGLELLGKELGMFKERVDLTERIDFDNLTSEEWDKILDHLAAQAFPGDPNPRARAEAKRLSQLQNETIGVC